MFEMVSTHDETQKVLHSDFDINTHKKTFIDYLEVIIDEDGTVMYAVPSHVERLTELYMGRHAITRKELMHKMLHDPGCCGIDMSEWLCKQLHCICVWNDTYKGEPNQKQLNKLKTLKLSGVYHGPVHNTYEAQRKECEKIAKELKEFASKFIDGRCDEIDS